tara:strand:+ start:1403 stop:1888 length:486 start_codon:yes stop_codon:yes gene_type:complete
MSNGAGPTQAEMDRQSRKWSREENYDEIIAAGGAEAVWLGDGGRPNILEDFLGALSNAAHDLQIEVDELFRSEREDGESVSNARMAAEEQAHARSLEEADMLVSDFPIHSLWRIWVGLLMYDFRGELKESGESMTTKMRYDLIEFAQNALWHLSTENLPPE